MRRDLRSVSAAAQAGRATMIEIALMLARAVDVRGDEGPTTTVKLAEQLRVVMGVIMRVDTNDDAEDFVDEMGTPVRDAALAGPGDAGAAGVGDRPTDGEAVPAASGLHGGRGSRD